MISPAMRKIQEQLSAFKNEKFRLQNILSLFLKHIAIKIITGSAVW